MTTEDERLSVSLKGVDNVGKTTHLAWLHHGMPGADELNMVPMLHDVNQRQMTRLEQRWKEAVDQGKTVDLEMELECDEESGRPTELVVSYKIEGQKRRTVVLENPFPEETDQ